MASKNKNLLDEPVTSKETTTGCLQMPNSKYWYSHAATSMQGRRKTQEDSHDVAMNVGEQDHHFIMVCDGHGGSFVAGKVKEMMLKHIVEVKEIQKVPDGSKKERYKAYSSGE